jgi:hypothetical protein
MLATSKGNVNTYKIIRDKLYTNQPINTPVAQFINLVRSGLSTFRSHINITKAKMNVH